MDDFIRPNAAETNIKIFFNSTAIIDRSIYKRGFERSQRVVIIRKIDTQVGQRSANYDFESGD